MAQTKLNSYTDVQNFISATLAANGSNARHAPHGNFWANLTYEQFTSGSVPGVTDPVSQQPLRILIPGNSRGSNLILALEGAPNTPFDPNIGAFGIMPADGSAPFTADQIAIVADWIDRDCPK